MEGQVYKSTGMWYDVKLDSGQSMACRIRGKLKLDKLKVTNPVAVGDTVTVIQDPNHEGTGIITNIIPRKNYVMRKSVHKAKHGNLIAANIDQALLIATLHHPKTSLGFIDRFLITTDSFRIPTTIIYNKSDLLSDNDRMAFEDIQATYSKIGIKTILISALNNHQLVFIKELLTNKITLVSGHSGTGKSTIVNKLIPESNQKIGQVSEAIKKGVHTTTFAQMFDIDTKTKIIDTPGIKELGLIDITEEELPNYFPEMRALLGSCKYHNCKHTHEPHCAVLQAVEDGNIAISRYYSYLSMLENEDRRW